MEFPPRGLAGGEGDFSIFYKSFFRFAVWALMSAYAINLHTAEELVQDAMMSMYKEIKGDEFSRMSDDARRGWLMKTASRNAIDRWRRGRREVLGDPDDNSCHSAAGDLEAVLIRDVIERLPVDLRKIAVLRYVAGLSNYEVAKVAGINVNTVGSRLRKARKLLIDELFPGENLRTLKQYMTLDRRTGRD